MPEPVGVRQRGPKKKVAEPPESPASPASLASPASPASPSLGSEDEPLVASNAYFAPAPIKGRKGFKIALVVLTLIAFITRFINLGHPDEVVFDEVHFGKVGPRESLA